MKKKRPFREGAVHVLDGKCSTCIFRPGNLMMLAPGRVDSMAAESVAAGGVITCHKTLYGDQAVCRGFFDVHKHEVLGLELAERLDMVTYVRQPGLEC